MSAQSDIRALLAGYAPLTALVSTRIALNAVPQDSPLPVVAFSTSGSPEYTLSDEPVDYALSVEVQCWADTSAAAISVAAAVRAAIEADAPRRGWVVAESTGYDSAMDLHAQIITVEWWVV